MLMTLYAATVDFTTATEDTLAGSSQSFAVWTGRLFNSVFVIALLLLLIYLIWGAIGWITAGGEASKVQSARDKMTQAVIGVIVLASTFALFSLIQSFLGVEIFTLGDSAGGAGSVTTPESVTTTTRTGGGSGNFILQRLRDLRNN